MLNIISVSQSFHYITEFYYIQVNWKSTFNFVYSNHTICYARTRHNVTHLFIHLNLCIALALGLVVFIAGIENATNNEVSMCKLHRNIELNVTLYCLGWLHVCSSTLTVFIHICFLLDVVWRSVSLHAIGHCVW